MPYDAIPPVAPTHAILHCLRGCALKEALAAGPFSDRVSLRSLSGFFSTTGRTSRRAASCSLYVLFCSRVGGAFSCFVRHIPRAPALITQKRSSGFFLRPSFATIFPQRPASIRSALWLRPLIRLCAFTPPFLRLIRREVSESFLKLTGALLRPITFFTRPRFLRT